MSSCMVRKEAATCRSPREVACTHHCESLQQRQEPIEVDNEFIETTHDDVPCATFPLQSPRLEGVASVGPTVLRYEMGAGFQCAIGPQSPLPFLYYLFLFREFAHLESLCTRGPFHACMLHVT